MIAGVGGIAVRALAARYDRTLNRRPLLDPTARREGGLTSGPLNFLLVGWDPARPDRRPGVAAIVIMHVAPGLDRAHLVAVPGDLLTEPPQPADAGQAGAERLAAALDRYDEAGADAAQKLSAALAALVGLRFDGAVIIDVAAFERVIDLLGGIELAEHAPAAPPRTADRPDRRAMDGGQALAYAREGRRPERDRDSHRQHQQVWRATAARITEFDPASNPIKLDQVVRAIGSALVVDTNGRRIDDLVTMLGKLRPDDVAGVQLPVRPLANGTASPRVLCAEAHRLLGCLRRGELAAWIEQNPQWINPL